MKRCKFCGSTKLFKVMVEPFNSLGYYHCLGCNASAMAKNLFLETGKNSINEEKEKPFNLGILGMTR